MITVSFTSILDISFCLIPRVIYIPSSFFLLRIRNLLAYTTKKPKIRLINTETLAIIPEEKAR